jgi:hypothetical protein
VFIEKGIDKGQLPIVIFAVAVRVVYTSARWVKTVFCQIQIGMNQKTRKTKSFSQIFFEFLSRFGVLL